MAGALRAALLGAALAALLACAAAHDRKHPGLRDNYYYKKCPDVESIVADRMAYLYQQDNSIAAQLVRLVFHDCFVRGCDASVLLDGKDSEKTASTNYGLGGFDVIDDIKGILEKQCPGIVSCADILVLAARESVRLTGGPSINVRLGRWDGKSSRDWETRMLPPNTGNVGRVRSYFQTWGMDDKDMVALSGAHTIGVSHCKNIEDRLKPKYDDLLNPGYGRHLKRKCKGRRGYDYERYVYNDPVTPVLFDNWYYKNVLQGQGTLKVDAALGYDGQTGQWVNLYAADNNAWFNDFSDSFRKLTERWVDQPVEIRCNCRKTNKKGRK